MKRVFVGSTVAGLLGAATLAVSSAFAIDPDVSVGSDGVSASVGADRASVGASAGSDGASAGASASSDAASASASASASADSSGVSADVGVSVSVGSSPSGSGAVGATTAGAAAPAAASPRQARAAAPPPVAARGNPENASLPDELLPRDICLTPGARGCRGTRPDNASIDSDTPQFGRAVTALALYRAAPVATVTACREGIVRGAMAYDPVQVDAVSAGEVQPLAGGGQMAPLVVRIVYSRQGGYEIREAKVQCQLDEGGSVIALR